MRKKITWLALLLLCHNLLLGQKEIIFSDTGKNGIVKFQKFDTSTNPKLTTNEKDILKEALKMAPDDSLKLEKTITEGKYIHKIYQQIYKGYRVVGGSYSTHNKNGKLESINGFFQNVGNPNIKSVINEQTALNRALTWIGAKRYGWEEQFTESLYKEQQKDSAATLKPHGELVIIFDDSITHNYRLAYKFPIYAVMPLVDKNVYVDAISGNVIGAENLIQDGNVVGTAATLYSGTQNITMDSYSSPIKYRLEETRTTNNKTAQIQTYNMQNSGSYSSAIDFSNSATSWTTADAGLDVQWGTEKVFDYWSTVRGRNSYNNSGGALKGYVHANLMSLGYPNNDNAFWSSTMNAMTYGDGSTQFNSVVSLDVIAHEIGHGVCQYTAQLNSGNTSQNNEQSALNEGLSDIWGAVIENWAASNKQTWEIGEDIMKNGEPCLRSLNNPKSLGYPDTYKGTYWSTSQEPHKNSTVFSHWFYLLSQGGSGTNDLNNSYSVVGIGIPEAANIVWNAESTGKLLSQSQYSDARTAMISAATELYGASSNEVIQTTRAWYAVGVGADYNFTGSYPISGPTTICSSGSFSISNLPSNYTVTWSSTILAGSATVSLTPSGSSVTVSASGSAEIQLNAHVTNGSIVFDVSKSIFAGVPIASLLSVTGDLNISLQGPGQPAYYGYYYNGTVCNSAYTYGITSAQYQIVGNYTSAQYGSGMACAVNGQGETIVWGSSGTRSIQVRVQNACGWSGWSPTAFVYANMTGSLYLISPNPALDVVNIQPNSTAATNLSASSTGDLNSSSAPNISQVNIYGKTGNLLRTQKFSGSINRVQINVAGLASGLYFVEIVTASYREKQNLLIR